MACSCPHILKGPRGMHSRCVSSAGLLGPPFPPGPPEQPWALSPTRLETPQTSSSSGCWFPHVSSNLQFSLPYSWLKNNNNHNGILIPSHWKCHLLKYTVSFKKHLEGIYVIIMTTMMIFMSSIWSQVLDCNFLGSRANVVRFSLWVPKWHNNERLKHSEA